MIPNIIHFMYFNGPDSREFGFINYLAVRTAHEVQKPDIIYFYYNEEPADNPNWERIRPYVKMVKIDPPEEYGGVPLKYPQYKADIVRLQKLLIHGGIYLDTDILMLKPLTPLMNNECVLGAEGYVDQAQDLHTNDIKKIGSISNAVIMAEPSCRFLKEWLLHLPKALMSGVWAYHAVTLPLELYKKDNSLFELQEAEAFIPFDFRHKYIFENKDGDKERLSSSYTMHMWETIWKDDLLQIDKEYLETQDNLFCQLFGKYAQENIAVKCVL